MASVSKKIKMALAYEGMSEAELARRLGFSPAAFNQRMATDQWSADLLIPVSYTHLDVYKRQVIEFPADQVRRDPTAGLRIVGQAVLRAAQQHIAVGLSADFCQEPAPWRYER